MDNNMAEKIKMMIKEQFVTNFQMLEAKKFSSIAINEQAERICKHDEQ